MDTKAKQSIELAAVLISFFLIITLFAVFSPYVFSAKVAVPVKILVELLPYILMAGLVLAVTKRKKRPLSAALGLKKSDMPKQLLIALLIFVITILFVIIPLTCGIDKQEILSFKARNPLVLLYSVVKAMVFVGFGEELIWRGYVYERFIHLTGSGAWAAVLSSILFGFWHYSIGHSILQVLMVTGIGLIYGFSRLKFKNGTVIATGMAHGLHDSVILILSYILL